MRLQKKTNLFKLPLFVFFFLICLSCNQKRADKEIEEIVSKWIGKEIVFPDTVLVLNNSEIKNIYEFSTFDVNDLKIVTYIEGDCHACVKELNNWSKIIQEQDKFKFKVIFFIFVTDLDYFINGYYKDVTISNPLVIDLDNKFELLNRFSPNKQFQTFLLDRNNRVMLIGNPVLNDKIYDLYFDVLKKNTPL